MSPKKAQTSAKVSATKKMNASPAKSVRKSPTKSPSPAKPSVESTMPAAKRASSARPGSERRAPDDAEPKSPAKRGPGRPRKAGTRVGEDEVVESIEESVRRAGRPRAGTPRARSSGPSTSTRSRSPEKQLQPAPRQRSTSRRRKAAPSTEYEAVTPSRKLSNKGLSQTGLSARMATLKADQQLLRELEQDDSDTPVVGEDNIYQAGDYDDLDEPAASHPVSSRARPQSTRTSRSTPAPSAQGKLAGSPKKPDTTGRARKEGHGSVTSFTNPENIPSDDHISDYKDSQGRGPFPNPFHEKMPLKEVWYRNMPPTFPFGETAYYEQKMSDQINADLSRSHQETLDAQKRQKGSGSVLGEIGSTLTSGVSSVLGMVTGTASPKKSPNKSPKKNSTDEALQKRFTPWDLPEIELSEVSSFAQSSGITA